jgi:hypothetical protein
MTPTVRLALAPVLLVALVGCADGGGTELVEAGEEVDQPRLAVARPTEAYPDALVRGRLEVNAAGCFAVDGDVLLAPAGSEVLEDGGGVSIPGLGDIRVGEGLESGGGFFEGPRLLGDDADCLPRRRGGVVLVAPGE